MARSKTSRARTATANKPKPRRRRSARIKAADASARAARVAAAKERRAAKAEAELERKKLIKSVFSHVEIPKKNVNKKEYVCYLGCKAIDSYSECSGFDQELAAVYKRAEPNRGTWCPETSYEEFPLPTRIEAPVSTYDRILMKRFKAAEAPKADLHPDFKRYLDETPQQAQARWREWIDSGCEGTTD